MNYRIVLVAFAQVAICSTARADDPAKVFEERIAPIFKSTVRATYRLAKTPKAAFSGAQQQINGILAEARAEDAHHFSMRAAEELRAAA